MKTFLKLFFITKDSLLLNIIQNMIFNESRSGLSDSKFFIFYHTANYTCHIPYSVMQ